MVNALHWGSGPGAWIATLNFLGYFIGTFVIARGPCLRVHHPTSAPGGPQAVRFGCRLCGRVPESLPSHGETKQDTHPAEVAPASAHPADSAER